MNLQKAHADLDNAGGAIRQWLMIDADMEIVLELIESAKCAENLEKAKAYTRSALNLFGHDDSTGDEIVIVRNYLRSAIAELKYQLQRDAA